MLGLVGSGAFLALAVLIQGTWRLAPPASRLAARAVSDAGQAELARGRTRAHFRSLARDSSPVVLTEVSTVNHDVILDDDLAPSDWVELYNRSDRPVSLTGWRLVESGRPRRGWVFPDLTLAPRTHLIVWASGKDRVGGAASRRVNTLVTRRARVYHTVDDVHTPLPRGMWKLRRARRVKVDVAVPEGGSFTLWVKARARGLSGTMRVRVRGFAPTVVAVSGGRPHHFTVGAEGSVQLPGPGVYTVDLIAVTGDVDVTHVALARTGSFEDRYARHVHAGFRLGRGREGVMLVDAMGVLRDELPPTDHPPTSTLQREPGSLAWTVGPPTPAGRRFSPGPDLATYPSLSAGPLRVAPDRPPGVDELRYTLDGGVPTAGAPRLEGSLELTRPTALRLRGYSGGVPVTPIVTRQFWVGPPPTAPAFMLALDPLLISDSEIGIVPNDRWRRQQELPDDPSLGPWRLTRSRVWARERRAWIKPAHLLLLDRDGVLFDGRARVRRFTTAVGPGVGLHVRTRDPARPTRDFFGRALAAAGRSFIMDEDAKNMPAFDVVRAAGGMAPRTAWGLAVVNGADPQWRVLVEPVDSDFLVSRWGHGRFDLLRGKPPFAVKSGTTAALDALFQRLERGSWTAAELAPHIDLPGLSALHLAALFLATGHNGENWQAYFAVDQDRAPPLLHVIGWDLDLGIGEGYAHHTLGVQRAYIGRHDRRHPFLAVRVVLELFDKDPVFRESYLRRMERTLNHVLTPAWWDAKRREAGWATKPEWADRVTRFFRDRPAFLFGALARDRGLPSPRVVRVDVQGRGPVTVDGYAYERAYTGRYFGGGTVEIVVPPERRAAFRHFTVNGRREPGPVLRAPVTEDLAIAVRFED